MKKVILIFFLCFLQAINSQNCSINNCPLMQGVCYNNKCLCSRDYATVNNKYIDSKGISCNYRLKSRYIAFALEFFFPFGAGHLYAENIIFAVIKFSLFSLFVFGFCCELCCLKAKVGKCLVFITILFLLDVLGLLTFQIIDIICYALGYYKDGFGVSFQ